MAAAVAAAGTIDVLVNNAGIGIGGPVELVPVAEVRRLFETNVFGPLRMMQAVLPQMRARGSGTIVNLSSVSGRVAAPLSGFYAASKFALEALSEALHVEVGHFGIRTIIIEPGFFRTNISESHLDYGVDTPPYDELHTIMEQMDRTARPGRRARARGGGHRHRRRHRDAGLGPGASRWAPTPRWCSGPGPPWTTPPSRQAMREVLNLDW